MINNEREQQRLADEITALEAAFPGIERERAELEREILPRLESELKAAEGQLAQEVFDAHVAAAWQAAPERDPLIHRWNEIVADVLEVAAALGRYTGRVEWHRNLVNAEARHVRQDPGPLPEAIPFELLQQCWTALQRAWQTGMDLGQQDAEDQRSRATEVQP